MSSGMDCVLRSIKRFGLNRLRGLFDLSCSTSSRRCSCTSNSSVSSSTPAAARCSMTRCALRTCRSLQLNLAFLRSTSRSCSLALSTASALTSDERVESSRSRSKSSRAAERRRREPVLVKAEEVEAVEAIETAERVEMVDRGRVRARSAREAL